MQFLRKLIDRIQRFMSGRYGADALFYVLFALFLLLNLFGNLLRWQILWLLSFVPAGIAVFRYYSRNIARRRTENRRLLTVWARVKGSFTLLRDRVRDRKICRYRRCKACRAVLRLPIRRGSNTAVCPRCGARVKVHIWF